MKKSVKLVLALVFCMACLCLTGCNNDAKKIVGKWNWNVDVLPILKEQAGLPEEVVPYFDGLSLDAVYEFTTDKKFTVSVSADSANAFMDKCMSGLKQYMTAEYESQLEGSDMTLNDVANSLGYDTFDEYLDSMSGQAFDSSAITKSFEKSGKYEIEDGKIYLAEGEAVNKSVYETYEWDGDDTLKITGSVGGEESEFIKYPFSMTRIK